MKERKEIDRLFQEQFKDFEQQPGPEVWAGIKDRLDKKKNKRATPLWWKLGAAAAVLVLLLVLGDLYFSPSGNPLKEKTPVVVTNDHKSAKEENQKPDTINDAKAPQNTVVSNDKKEQQITEDTTTPSRLKSQEQNSLEAVAANKKENAYGENDKKAVKTGQKAGKLAQNRSKSSENTEKTTETEAIADQENALSNDKNLSNKVQNRNNIAENQTEKSVNSDENRSDVANNDATKEETEEEALAALTSSETTKDEADFNDEKSPAKRWALTPNVAPVYYDSFGGSGIDPQFNGNSKEGGVNLSYGLLVSYAVNKKITIRSGVNRIGLSYNTNNVAVSAGLQGGAIKSIDYASSSQVVEVSSSPLNSAVTNDLDNSVKVPERRYTSGSLDQSLAYYEVPMEVEYALVEQRIGLQLIGGVSTLILNDNEIELNQQNFTTSLGKSNSLNDVSFSTNIGIGLDYKFTDEIKFNLEPMFKYQLNAYKNSVSDFKPYYLGLYTGFSVKF